MPSALTQHFIPPSTLARAANRFYGWLTRLGWVPTYGYLLETKGRKTQKIHGTPVNLLSHAGGYFLVGTRGHTEWSRNLLAESTGSLRRGAVVMRFTANPLADETKPEILKSYLSRFRPMVWRFFAVAYDAPVAEFTAIAAHHPVFELTFIRRSIGAS